LVLFLVIFIPLGFYVIIPALVRLLFATLVIDLPLQTIDILSMNQTQIDLNVYAPMPSAGGLAVSILGPLVLTLEVPGVHSNLASIIVHSDVRLGSDAVLPTSIRVPNPELLGKVISCNDYDCPIPVIRTALTIKIGNSVWYRNLTVERSLVAPPTSPTQTASNPILRKNLSNHFILLV
jgi:hypothetical protein